jgi:hypothetical protein
MKYQPVCSKIVDYLAKFLINKEDSSSIEGLLAYRVLSSADRLENSLEQAGKSFI